MNSKVSTQEASNTLDTVKLALALAVMTATIVAFYWYEEQPLVLRIIGILVGAGISIGIALQTALGRRWLGAIQDSRAEVRKVVWPTRKETFQATLAVVLMVMIVGVALWLLDMALLNAVRFLTNQGA